jgi:two-component system, cell cycle response regulator
MNSTNNTNVLLVEDSPIYQRIVTGHLKNWGFKVQTATDGEQAWEILQAPDSPRLVVMDWVMPKLNGIDLCRRLRNRPDTEPYIYTLLLTGKDSQSDLLSAMDAGVDDYLAKPFDELELRARLMAGKRVVDLQDQLVRARESMRYAASYDSLTGLMNRKEVLDALTRELARSKREGKPLAIILADVDHFKSVNDSLGHMFGDEALKEVGRRLQSKLRIYDSVGRYGGEEFLLVFPGCELTSALIRADQIRSFVCSTPVSTLGKDRKITVSLGVVVADGPAEVKIEDLLHQADMALYEAKKKGRNRVEQLDFKVERRPIAASSSNPGKAIQAYQL